MNNFRNNGDGRRDNGGRFNNRDNRDNRGGGKFNNTRKPKPVFVKVKVEIGDSDFYGDNLDSLYNLLCSISFDKVAIPVTMSKAELFDNSQLKGTATFGTIEKFNNDNSFTVSVPEQNATKLTNGHVMSIRCKKDYTTSELTYVTAFTIVKGTAVKSKYDDVEKEMLGHRCNGDCANCSCEGDTVCDNEVE